MLADGGGRVKRWDIGVTGGMGDASIGWGKMGANSETSRDDGERGSGGESQMTRSDCRSAPDPASCQASKDLARW